MEYTDPRVKDEQKNLGHVQIEVLRAEYNLKDLTETISIIEATHKTDTLERERIERSAIKKYDGDIRAIESALDILEAKLVKKNTQLNKKNQDLKFTDKSLKSKKIECLDIITDVKKIQEHINLLLKTEEKGLKDLEKINSELSIVNRKLKGKKKELIDITLDINEVDIQRNNKQTEIDGMKNKLLGLQAKERKINELVPELKRLYAKVGMEIDI